MWIIKNNKKYWIKGSWRKYWVPKNISKYNVYNFLLTWKLITLFNTVANVTMSLRFLRNVKRIINIAQIFKCAYYCSIEYILLKDTQIEVDIDVN